MGSNRKLILGAALLASALVFWGLLRGINSISQRAAAVPTAAPIKSVAPTGRLIAYANADIPQGTLVTKGMLTMKPLEGNGSTTAFITSPEEQAFGFITNRRIAKNTIFRPSEDFVGHISETGIAGMLLPGRRAIVIPFANKPTLHDLVAIGNFVDINAAFDGQESRTIVPNVRVLAVDVFGSDFPQVNIARRGAFKAEVRGAAPAPVEGSAPGAPGATPTPTPAPAQAPARPDPSITLEVTPAQANTILLAQASGGVLDFVVLPITGDPVIVPGAEAPGIGPDGQPLGGDIVRLTSSVTKAQIAPYAERKKAAGGNATPATRVAAAGEKFFKSAGEYLKTTANLEKRATTNNNPYGPLSKYKPGPDFPTGGPGPFNPGPIGSPPPVESPTYNIPIYADGRTVRVETVPRPAEPRSGVPLPQF